MEDQLSEYGRVLALYRVIFLSYRRICKSTIHFLNIVLYKMRTPSSLLEISKTAVLKYALPSDELPKELELQLRETEEKTSNLKNCVKCLEHEVRRIVSEVSKTVLKFDVDFDTIE